MRSDRTLWSGLHRSLCCAFLQRLCKTSKQHQQQTASKLVRSSSSCYCWS